MKNNIISKTAYVLLVIGGLNWGIIGFFDYNIIGKVFSDEVARIIYGAVGLAALHGVYVLSTLQPATKTPKTKVP